MTDDRPARRRQDAIARRLRHMYDEVLHEELPEDFITLLCEAGLQVELRRQEAERKKRRDDRLRDEPMPHDLPRPGPKRPLLSTAAQPQPDGSPPKPADERRSTLTQQLSARRRQEALGRRLRQAYESILEEDPPEEFIELLSEAWLNLELKKPPHERDMQAPEDVQAADQDSAGGDPNAGDDSEPSPT